MSLAVIDQTKSQCNVVNLMIKYPRVIREVKRCKWLTRALNSYEKLSQEEQKHVLLYISSVDSSALEELIQQCGLEGGTVSSLTAQSPFESLSSLSCNNLKNQSPMQCSGCNLKILSPLLLKYSKNVDTLAQIGIIVGENDIAMNGNRFARHILRFYKIAYSSGDRFHIYELGRWRFIDSNELSRLLRDFLHSHYPDLWNDSHEKKYLSALKREAERIDAFDVERDYINLQNGMLETSKCTLVPHSPEFKSSVQIPLNYDATEQCPKFMSFLESIFDYDSELIRVVQELIGYTISSNVSAQKAFLFYGRGANGKSILSKVMVKIVGEENVSTIPLSELERPFSRFQLIGKTLNLATENEVSENGISTTHFKSIVGGDPITVEEKFKQPFVYTPQVKLVFSLNNLPKSRDRSFGFQRRLIIIPFNRTFRETDADTINSDILINSLYEELPGILNFALQGLQRLSSNNYVFSKAVKIDQALDEYIEEINPFFSFVDDKLEQAELTDRLFNDRLVDEFKKWCAANGHQKLAKDTNQSIINEIRTTLKEKGYDFESGSKLKSGGKRYMIGVKLKNPKLSILEQDQDFLELISDPEFEKNLQ